MNDVRESCNLSDEAFEARRTALRRDLEPRARGRETLADGVAVLFDASLEMRGVLDDFVAFERECCPGLGFSVEEAGGALRLEIHGVDPNSRLFADVASAEAAEPAPAVGGVRAGLRVLRSVGFGAAGAFTLFCLVPMALVALLGAELAGPLFALDDPKAVAAGGLVFGGLLWRWERRRAADRAASSGCGC
ncbi:MAG: hypothetical protein JRH10_11845 [Deltaproteobacteria bacterium]|nr:hypothetical protein [Deltaproteobacteria bacterium]